MSYQHHSLSHNAAAILLVFGCILFGFGSLIVHTVQVGTYALSFWRLAVASLVFLLLMKVFRLLEKYFSLHSFRQPFILTITHHKQDFCHTVLWRLGRLCLMWLHRLGFPKHRQPN